MSSLRMWDFRNYIPNAEGDQERGFQSVCDLGRSSKRWTQLGEEVWPEGLGKRTQGVPSGPGHLVCQVESLFMSPDGNGSN
jgi:hypothetical protein